jgi:hypothetical protein
MPKKVCKNCMYFFKIKRDDFRYASADGECMCMPEPRLFKLEETAKRHFCGQFKARKGGKS